jgi:predicted secreted protein
MTSDPKPRNFQVFFGILAIGAVLAGCGWLGNKPDIEAKAEHPVEIRLPANPSTGYRWMLDPPLQSGRILSESYESGAKDGRAGAPGTQILQVVFPREGRFNLKLAYRRLWEPLSIPPAQTTNLVVKVLPAKGDSSLMERLFTKDIAPATNIPQPEAEEEQPQTTTRKVELRRPR